MSLTLLSLSDIKQSISMNQAIDAMERAFIQLANGQVKLPMRTSVAIEAEQALSLTMPAYLEQEKALGLKVVSIFPKNVSKGLPAINGFMMLLDAQTGEPKVLMDAGYLTALRTGAVSGLATKYLAKETAKQVAIIGSGVQAVTQLEAVAAVRPIEQVTVWSRQADNALAFVEQHRDQYDIRAVPSVTEAIANADIICTATSSVTPLFSLKDVKPDAHINAIGSHTRSMQEFDVDILVDATVFVDQVAAVLSEAGEIIEAMELDRIPLEELHEIGAWLLTKSENYSHQLTVFKSVGLAIQDISVAEMVYQNALAKQLGVPFDLGQP